MAQKWLIQDNRLLIGDVQLHRHLLTSFSNVKGGGHWFVQNRVLYLYSHSTDYGQCKLFDVVLCKKLGNYPPEFKMKWVFSNSDSLYQAINMGIDVVVEK